MFVLAKLFWLLAAPTQLLLILLVVGEALRFAGSPVTGGWLAAGTTLVLAAVAVLPVGRWLLAILERRFPAPNPMPARVDGIVVLGGWLEPRLSAATLLAAQYPRARFVYTGGDGSLSGPSAGQAAMVRALLAALNLDSSRLIIEDRSRTTVENVILSKPLAAPRPEEVWLLVTSAGHMPRAMGVFRKQGWAVVPYPIGFIALGRPNPFLQVPATHRLLELDHAAREWIGLLAYRLLGRTSSLYPGPEPTSATLQRR